MPFQIIRNDITKVKAGVIGSAIAAGFLLSVFG